MKQAALTVIGALLVFEGECAHAAINYEYRGGWDQFSSPSASGSAAELIHGSAFSSPLTLTDPNISNNDLVVSDTHVSSIDFHQSVQTPLFETGQGRGQGFLYVMGLKDLTVKSGWQTLVSNEFTWANSTWSVAIDTSLGLDRVMVQGFWRNSSGSVSTYSLGTVNLGSYHNTTIAFGMQRLTAAGERVGTFFYANDTSQMLNNGSLIAHNNGNPLGNAVLGLGPQTGQLTNGNQGNYSMDNVYVYNMWTDSTAIHAADLQLLTSAAHSRRDVIPETSSALMALVGGGCLFIRRKRRPF